LISGVLLGSRRFFFLLLDEQGGRIFAKPLYSMVDVSNCFSVLYYIIFDNIE